MDRMYFYDKEGQHGGLYFLFHGEEKDLKKVKVALTLLEDEGLGTDRKVGQGQFSFEIVPFKKPHWSGKRSEEHTSELQSRPHLVCRLLLEKKKKKKNIKKKT